jgi:hypothetical protein
VSGTSIAFDIYAKDHASGTFDKTGRAAESSAGRFARAGKMVRNAGIALGAGIGAATLVGAKFAKEAAEDEQSSMKLARAMKNNADATNGQIKSTEAWISAQGRAFGVVDEDLRPALARLVQSTHDVGEAQRLARLAEDVSAGSGRKLAAVSLALGKGYDGNTQGLARLGIKVKDAHGKMLTFQQIVKSLSTTFKGQAATAADTAAGKYNRVKVAVREAGESIGYKLLGPAAKFGDWVTGTGLPVLDKLTTYVGDRLSAAISGTEKKVSGIADSFQSLQDIDGAAIGKNLSGAIVSGLAKLGNLSDTLLDKLDASFAKVDWVGLGITLGQQAPAMLIGLAAGILNFDLGGLLHGVGDHWFTILVGVLTIAFAPAKLVGKVAELLDRIPLGGKLIGWMLRSLNGVGGRMKGFGGELIGWFWRGLRSGLDKEGPTVVARLIGWVRRIPSQILKYQGKFASSGADLLRRMALGMGEGLGRGILKIPGIAARIPGLIKRGVKNPGGLLRDVGVQIVRGLGRGISGAAHLVTDAVIGLVNKVPKVVRKVLKIFSPSRVMHELGGYVTEGFAEGILGSKSQKLDTAIKKVVSKVTGLKKKLSSLLSDQKDFAGGFNFATSPFGADYGDSGPTIGGILAQQRGELAKSAQVKGDVSKLAKLGLSPSLIKQLQASGDTASLHQLAMGSKADIATANALDKQTQANYKAAGVTAGNIAYGGSVKDARDDLRMARALEKALKNAHGDVHIHLEGKDIIYSAKKYKKDHGGKKLGLD